MLVYIYIYNSALLCRYTIAIDRWYAAAVPHCSSAFAIFVPYNMHAMMRWSLTLRFLKASMHALCRLPCNHACIYSNALACDAYIVMMHATEV